MLLPKRKACEENAAGGTNQFLFVIPVCEVLENGFPPLKTTTAPGDSVTLDGGFTLTTDTGTGYWRRYDLEPDTGRVAAALVGENRATAFEQMADGYLAGTDSICKEALQNFVGKGIIAISPDRNGIYHVTGDLDNPAYLQTGDGFDTKTTITELAGSAFSFKSMSPRISPTYDIVANPLNLTPNP